MQTNSKKYYIYILLCENDILYTGVTTDFKRRFMEHLRVNGNDRGAKFTKTHKPIEIVALWETSNRSNAQKLESRIKKLTHQNKVVLIENKKSFKLFFNEVLNFKLYKRLT